MKQRLCCSRTGSFNSFCYNYLLITIILAHWLSRCLWTERSWVRIPPYPPRQGPWASPSLTVACSASTCKLWHSVNCCGRERLWVVVNLKRCYRNIRNEYHFPIVCGVWDNGGTCLYVWIHACMNECAYISVYVAYVGVHACTCMCVLQANNFINVKMETK